MSTRQAPEGHGQVSGAGGADSGGLLCQAPVSAGKRPAVVATNRRLLLLKLNILGRATGLLGEAPRETRLGPCQGILTPLRAFDSPLQVSFRFFKDVDEADRAAGLHAPRT